MFIKELVLQLDHAHRRREHVRELLHKSLVVPSIDWIAENSTLRPKDNHGGDLSVIENNTRTFFPNNLVNRTLPNHRILKPGSPAAPFSPPRTNHPPRKKPPPKSASSTPEKVFVISRPDAVKTRPSTVRPKPDMANKVSLLSLQHCELFCSPKARQQGDNNPVSRIHEFLGLGPANFSTAQDGFEMAAHHLNSSSTQLRLRGTPDQNFSSSMRQNHSQCIEAVSNRSLAQRAFPDLNISAVKDYFSAHKSPWGSPLLGFQGECTGSNKPHGKQTFQSPTQNKMIHGPIDIGSSQPEKLRIACLVVGGYRVYDGTWPGHEKYLYKPLRKHPTTAYLHVFVCTDIG